MYKYYNNNPKNIKTGDCVCRAISTATGLNYEAVDNLLELTSAEYGCSKLCVCCYHRLLEDILCYDRYVCTKNERVKDLARKYPRDIILARLDGHLTCVIKGNVLDIWDCSDKIVDCYWFVK